MPKLLITIFCIITAVNLTVGNIAFVSTPSFPVRHHLKSVHQKSPYDFEIIPNYVHEKITLKINSSDKHLKTIKIFDIIGNEIFSLELVHKELYKYDIDFSSFRPGVYLCNLYSDKGIVATRKLLYR